MAGARPVHHQFPAERRHECGAGRNPRDRDCLRAAQSRLRPALSPARSEDPLMAGAPLAEQPAGLRAWLLSAEPHSRWQARLGRFYLGWRSFTSNPLAMLGLGIVLLLVLMALLADVIAPYSPVT